MKVPQPFPYSAALSDSRILFASTTASGRSRACSSVEPPFDDHALRSHRPSHVSRARAHAQHGGRRGRIGPLDRGVEPATQKVRSRSRHPPFRSRSARPGPHDRRPRLETSRRRSTRDERPNGVGAGRLSAGKPPRRADRLQYVGNPKSPAPRRGRLFARTRGTTRLSRAAKPCRRRGRIGGRSGSRVFA